ncbi:hypothetical protein K7432_003320 [Basidiobolus ranarum]|uniref:C2 domain-containing protein n=1 Tax=Basidiobolus ranarum TaxID=34480 RepID=A0ABR2X026_9FUNG
MTQISVTVVEARNLQSNDLFDKIDPVIKVYTGRGFTSKGKTSVRKDDTNPTWNESFKLKFNHRHDTLHVELGDSKIKDTEKVGSCGIPLAELKMSGCIDSWYVLSNKVGKSVGEVHLIIAKSKSMS